MCRLKTIILLLLLCSTTFAGKKYLRYKYDKNSVIYGDSILLSWESPKKYLVSISGFDSVFNNTGQIKIIPREKQQFIITAIKGKNKITRKTRKIKIIYPQFHFFTATRDPSHPEKIIIRWNTENFRTVSIERIGTDLLPSGQTVITEPDQIKLSMEVENYLGEKLVRFANVPKDYTLKRAYLKGLKKFYSNDSIPFYMEIISVNVSEYPENIELKVIVYDTLGNYITGLAPPYASQETASEFFKRIFIKNEFGEKSVNFKVKEIREEENNKADISFVMDQSGSMNDVIDDFKNIATYFIENKNKYDRISLVVFDHRLYKLQDLTTDTSILTCAIKQNKYILGGSTALYAACDEGLESIRYSNGERILIVFTDGHENSSFPYFGYRTIDANHLANKIRKTHTKLYVIGYGSSVNYEVMEQLCELSNGRFYYISKFSDLQNALYEIGLLIKSYYSITFSPPKTNGPTDIKLVYHNVNSDMIIENNYYIGEVEQIVEKEMFQSQSFQKDTVKILFPPQVIANFQFNKAFIEDQYRSQLDNYSQYLKKNPSALIMITGHSDSKGKEPYRHRISEKRAETVADYLIQNGIDPKRIQTKYYSFSHPMYSVEEYEWQARENRRVEIILYTRN